jgi:hypothetical protein
MLQDFFILAGYDPDFTKNEGGCPQEQWLSGLPQFQS